MLSLQASPLIGVYVHVHVARRAMYRILGYVVFSMYMYM